MIKKKLFKVNELYKKQNMITILLMNFKISQVKRAADFGSY